MKINGKREDYEGFPDGLVVKNSPANGGDPGSILGNPMDRGVWQAIVPRVTKSWTQLSD